jgi:uridine kinase
MVTFDMIKNHLLVYGSVNVIIAGQTCSGKTTLAKEIRDHFLDEYSVAIISQDDYFKNLEDIPHSPGGYLTDSIDAFHVAEFRDDVYTLLKNSIVTMPNYDVATNTRINKNKIVSAGKINIFEGLHTISILYDMTNCINIFVDTDVDVCLKRRIVRDTSKYGIPEHVIKPYWKHCIMPMCEEYIFPQLEYADVTINRKGGDC